MHVFLTGLFTGFAMISKWSGVFALGIVGFFEVVSVIDALLKKDRELTKWSTLIGKGLLLLLFPIMIYLLGYSHMFLQGKSLSCQDDHVVQGKCFCRQDSSWWVNTISTVLPQQRPYLESLEARGGCKRLISHFSELHHQIWWYQTNLKATHPFQSRPIEWFLNLRPVWMHVEYHENQIVNIYAQGNSMLFWAGDVAIFMTIFYLLVTVAEKVSKKKVKVNVWPLFFVLFAYSAVWVPWQASPRIMFFYHYTPAVPFLCMILAYWLNELWGNEEKLNGEMYVRRGLVSIVVIAIALNFMVFYPNWAGISVPKAFADKVYFALPSWK
jgi:dolichyl-phosphate-mannose--protein O-mannosyl transferase